MAIPCRLMASNTQHQDGDWTQLQPYYHSWLPTAARERAEGTECLPPAENLFDQRGLPIARVSLDWSAAPQWLITVNSQPFAPSRRRDDAATQLAGGQGPGHSILSGLLCLKLRGIFPGKVIDTARCLVGGQSDSHASLTTKPVAQASNSTPLSHSLLQLAQIWSSRHGPSSSTGKSSTSSPSPRGCHWQHANITRQPPSPSPSPDQSKSLSAVPYVPHHSPSAAGRRPHKRGGYCTRLRCSLVDAFPASIGHSEPMDLKFRKRHRGRVGSQPFREAYLSGLWGREAVTGCRMHTGLAVRRRSRPSPRLQKACRTADAGLQYHAHEEISELLGNTQMCLDGCGQRRDRRLESGEGGGRFPGGMPP